MQCPCNPNNLYTNCCEPLHQGKLAATTAVQLMRARYSAYALCKIDYLVRTTHASTRHLYLRASMLKWANTTTFHQLEIVYESPTIVEFKAHYTTGNTPKQLLHERSVFVQENKLWYYTQGEYATTAVN